MFRFHCSLPLCSKNEVMMEKSYILCLKTLTYAVSTYHLHKLSVWWNFKKGDYRMMSFNLTFSKPLNHACQPCCLYRSVWALAASSSISPAIGPDSLLLLASLIPSSPPSSFWPLAQFIHTHKCTRSPLCVITNLLHFCCEWEELTTPQVVIKQE